MGATLTIDDPTYFDRLARVESEHWWSLGMWNLASRWLDGAVCGRRGLRALDAGCGAGLTAHRLAERAEIQEVVALDPGAPAVALAKRRSETHVLQGSVIDLPFREESFDLVTCFDVLQHLPPGGDRRAADEMFRVLRSSGIALIRSNGVGGWRGERREGSPYQLRDLSQILEDAGFAMRRATYANCLPSLAQEARGRLGRKAGGHPNGKGLRIDLPPPWINRMMGAVSGWEAWMVGSRGWSLPFGHSTMLLAEKR